MSLCSLSRVAQPSRRAMSTLGRFSRSLRVATCNLKIRDSLDETVARASIALAKAAGAGADVLALPECALPGYDAELIQAATPAALRSAERSIRDACRAHGIGAVYGAPRDGYNEAVVVDGAGDVVARQPKLQLVPTDAPWTTRAGESQLVFRVGDVPCAVIICHDKRYPELCRLPVLAGARVLFYISCETYHDDVALPAHDDWAPERLDAELGVYRAQCQARAVENGVFVVKSNVAAGDRGSHGMSAIFGPTGVVIEEAGLADENVLVADLDLAEATALYAAKSVRDGYAHKATWDGALGKVTVLPPGYKAPF